MTPQSRGRSRLSRVGQLTAFVLCSNFRASDLRSRNQGTAHDRTPRWTGCFYDQSCFLNSHITFLTLTKLESADSRRAASLSHQRREGPQKSPNLETDGLNTSLAEYTFSLECYCWRLKAHLIQSAKHRKAHARPMMRPIPAIGLLCI